MAENEQALEPPPRKRVRGRYRQYLWDESVEVPKSTKYRRRALGELNVMKEEPPLALMANDNASPSSREKFLYPGARISVKESVALILNLIRSHPALNKETLSHVLELIRAHVPTNAQVNHLDSMYKFSKVKQVSSSLYYSV